MIQVKDKVAFITGALGGIGQAYTKSLLRNGLKGASLIDINTENAESFQNELSKEFGPNKTIFIKTDLRKRDQIQDAFEKTVAYFKQLDIVINNAGIANENSPEETITVNLIAPLIITDLALKTYLPKYQLGMGIIVNTASIAGLVNLEILPFYTVSKVGLVSISNTYATEANYQKYKVKFFTICPGATVTPLNVRVQSEFDVPFIPQDKCQSASVVGDCLLKAIESDKNGSVWVAESSKIAEFNCAQYESSTKKFIKELSDYQYI